MQESMGSGRVVVAVRAWLLHFLRLLLSMNLMRALYGSAVEHLATIDACIRQEGGEDGEFGRFQDIYVPQKFAWDCGLACCAMALQWKVGKTEKVYEHALALLASPLWTIDLLILLRDLEVEAEMKTICAGMQEHHTTYEWYSNGASNDILRISKQFAHAKNSGFSVIEVYSVLYIHIFCTFS